jgi:hypothetical protein
MAIGKPLREAQGRELDAFARLMRERLAEGEGTWRTANEPLSRIRERLWEAVKRLDCDVAFLVDPSKHLSRQERLDSCELAAYSAADVAIAAMRIAVRLGALAAFEDRITGAASQDRVSGTTTRPRPRAAPLAPRTRKARP